jgi:hypothetical protein
VVPGSRLIGEWMKAYEKTKVSPFKAFEVHDGILNKVF